jgi:hypothetical protein
MRRVLLLGGVIGVLGLIRVVVRAGCPTMMRGIMQRVMPRMMDRCFGRMSPGHRAAMLSECRNMLDRMAERYEITAAPE